MILSRLALVAALTSTLALAGCSSAQLESPPQDMATSYLAEESSLDSSAVDTGSGEASQAKKY